MANFIKNPRKTLSDDMFINLDYVTRIYRSGNKVELVFTDEKITIMSFNEESEAQIFIRDIMDLND